MERLLFHVVSFFSLYNFATIFDLFENLIKRDIFESIDKQQQRYNYLIPSK